MTCPQVAATSISASALARWPAPLALITCATPATAADPPAERLEQSLVLLALLLQSSQYLADIAVPLARATTSAAIASAAVAARASASATEPPPAAHGSLGGMVTAEEVGGGRHPEEGSGGASVTALAAMPGRLRHPPRRGGGEPAARNGCRAAQGRDSAQQRSLAGPRQLSRRENAEGSEGEATSGNGQVSLWRVMRKHTPRTYGPTPRKGPRKFAGSTR